MMKEIATIGYTTTISTLLLYIIGGWDINIQALFILMIIDYVTGLMVATIFKASPKTKSGTLSSRVGFKGLVKKSMMMLLVIIGHQLDIVIGWDNMVRTGLIIAFILNETLSVIENAGLMGVAIPAPLKKSIDVLRDRTEIKERTSDN